ncbi:MAG TPA: protein kinase [Burkholderiaceae bacterium]|nr:protein kinase [Burkholderiaceae bacterium]
MDKIGRYQIEDTIGQGATAVVFKAHDPEIDRTIAIKLLKPEFARNDDYRIRFVREAKGAGTLSHPNIVTVFDVGEHDGRPYIAMEYVEGTTLAQWMEDKPRLPVIEALVIARQLAAALGFAHKKGIVHRDVKPGNVMLMRDTQTVKVTDFGICRIEGGEATQATRVGDVLGTPHYMSPEQVLGQPADSRSDVFSTGIVLYQMLTGALPFTGDTLVSVGMKIAKTEPQPLQEMVPDMPAGVRRVVERALKKAPEKRYDNGEEFAQALQAVLTELEETASTRERGRRIPLGVKWAVIMGLLIAVTMTLAALFVQNRQRAALTAQVMDYGSSLAKFMASQSAVPVLGEEWVALGEFIKSSVSGQDFSYMVVVDHAGVVRGSSVAAQVGQPYKPAAGTQLADAPAQVAVTRVTAADGRDVLDFATPILFQNRTIGRVHLGIFETPLQRVVQLTLGLLGVLIVVTVAAAALGSFFMARRLILPLRTLRAGLSELAEGRYDFRIAEQRRDELGELYAAFDTTAAALQNRHEVPLAGRHDAPVAEQRRGERSESYAAFETEAAALQNRHEVLQGGDSKA